MQLGLQAAVDELKAVKESIELITDNLDIYEFGNPERRIELSEIQQGSYLTPLPPADAKERQHRLANLIQQGVVLPHVQQKPETEQDRAIAVGEAWQQMVQTPLFGNLPEVAKPIASAAIAKANFRLFPIRKDIDLPEALVRELPPDPAKLNDLVDDIAREFCRSVDITGLLQRKLKALTGVIQKVAELHDYDPAHRKEISLKSGVTLLQSPTGSGKTLILGRVLEGLRGALSRPVVWLWFAPYAGLVSQTREALVKQCGGLRVRDVATDRQHVGTRDSDVFIQTWATVAASNRDARKVRRTSESVLSFDDMIAALRASGFFVGVVIDEAHLNFGASATVAAEFYLNHIQPDFTILATATPNDEKLDAFEKKAGIEVASRVVVPRSEVVGAGLNKVGLKLGVVRFREGDQDLIDHEHPPAIGLE
ncbi:DEAD/DEAH box helicase family protein [Bradyrhizobium sp. URHD0069]|uniref:DEAD/DEAH box helicase family protein n=1 Tax=Bradyrhizobium sp. URHD0069 TaxID=1380355 RepID=UPI00049868E6|nr:DEAD/DEAH box helicase family protein [Bradyrhizobium sp. URHD0069]